ncbi:MAG TPA: hypothetical protein VFW45_11675 [Candidatus Polarisedimenticolia bacterium]|nr:hypothetical protein [Candidatus Polarisedimenticolia bacterium]
MKFLCLAYGSEEDWKALSREEREALLAQDEFLRQRGALMAAVECEIATVRAWDGRPDIAKGAYALSGVPLAGFSITALALLGMLP